MGTEVFGAGGPVVRHVDGGIRVNKPEDVVAPDAQRPIEGSDPSDGVVNALSVG